MTADVYRPFATSPERAFSTSLREPNLEEALIFLDTNTLLAPYRASNEALQAIKRTYEAVRRQGRLLVPGEVAREFARTRPLLLTRLHNSLRSQVDSVQLGKLEEVPILGEERHFREAARALEAAREEVKKYRAALRKLADKVEGWRTTDPVLSVYERLFDAQTVKDGSLARDALKTLAEARYRERIPPGFRDAGKSDGGYGDLAIWMTILECAQQQQRDAVFVSSDQKDDWYHVDEKHRIFPRYELTQEFSDRTSGKAFTVMTLADFLMKTGATDEVVQQVKQSEVLNVSALFSEHLSYEAAVLFVESRLISALGDRGWLSQVRGPLDITFESPEGQVGVEIALASINHAIFNEIIASLQSVRKKHRYHETAIVIVGPENQRELLNWSNRLAEESFLGAGISAIVCGVGSSRFDVPINQSRNSVLRRAFPRAT